MVIEEGADGVYLPIETSEEALDLMDRIGAGTDEEIRGMFARMLRDAKVKGNRAARIMRCGRTQYFIELKTPFPGINDNPMPPRPSHRPRTPKVRPKRIGRGQLDGGAA